MISLLLATAVTTGCLFSTTSCEVLDKIQDVIGGLLSPEKKPEDGKDNVIKGSTAHGNQTATGVVKKTEHGRTDQTHFEDNRFQTP